MSLVVVGFNQGNNFCLCKSLNNSNIIIVLISGLRQSPAELERSQAGDFLHQRSEHPPAPGLRALTSLKNSSQEVAESRK